MYEEFLGCDFVSVLISREEVEARDLSGPLSTLQRLLTRKNAIEYYERVNIAVGGYDDDPRELHEIPEVRNYIYKLDAEFPYWLYFLTKRGDGLMIVLSCHCSPFLEPEVQQRIWGEEVSDYLLKRGFPAMNYISELAGCSEEEIRRLSDRVIEYVNNGRDRSGL